MKLKCYKKDFSGSCEEDVVGIDVLPDDKGVVALKQCLVSYGANLRQGNACAKDRGEVSGSGKKPYRQKGTGMARQGSKRSPIWSGGGVVFGPKPRDYSQKMNKRVRLLALLRSLSDKCLDDNLFLVDELIVEQPKTKPFNEKLTSAFGRDEVLFVDVDFDDKFLLASGNIERVFLADANLLNAYDVVRYKNVVLTKKAMEVVVGRLSVNGD